MKSEGAVKLIILMLIISSVSSGQTADSVKWPTKGWETTSPADMNLDEKYFTEMDNYIKNSLPQIHSVVAVYKGKIIFEKYYNLRGPVYGPGDFHPVMSVTKSIVCTLIGILMKNGFICNLDQKLVDLLPEAKDYNPDSNLTKLTLRNLMTFRTGIKYDESGSDWDNYYSSYNWNKNFLSRSFAYKPGTHFNYESPSAHILSTIISKLTEKSVLDFAEEYLFSKLGISLPYWEHDNFGVNTGGWGLSMIPRDMAKIGYLMINNGYWDSEQILPEGWTDVVSSIYTKGFLWPHNSSYGYNWWIANNSPTPVYYAGGRGGQFICVAKDISLVVAITSYWDVHHEQNRFIIDNYLYPAINNSLQTSINEENKILPQNYLFQNYPNPFNPATNITYILKDEGRVTLKIYDILGREIGDLVNEYQTAGEHRVIFNSAASVPGSNLPSNIYFYKLNVNGFSSVKRMILLK